MLRVDGIRTGYGRSQVLFGIDLEIGDGEIVALMGRNGMGKTTTIRSIMGLTPPHAGSITFRGQELCGLAPHRVARLGLGLVPEGRGVFPTLTVRENLVATAATRGQRPARWDLAGVTRLFPWLDERRDQLGAHLSGGEQQMLAIARALMTNPELLILDEATEGLAPLIRAEIWRIVAALKQLGQSILIVDKNLNALSRLADRHYVVEKGTIKWSGDARTLTRDLERVRGYIGV